MKKATGFYLTAASGVMTIIALIVYIINCQTAYFSKSGLNPLIIAGGILAVISEAIYLKYSAYDEKRKLADAAIVISGVSITVCLITFIGSRVYGAASIMTFEMSEQNLADLTGAFIGIGICFAAFLMTIISSFMASYKKIEIKEEAVN